MMRLRCTLYWWRKVKSHPNPIHATCIAINGQGVLLLGASGAGKSDLALRLIDGGAMLVADDYVDIRAENGALIANPPERIAGLLEVRGVGIFTLPYATNIPLALAIQLVPREQVTRLPQAAVFDCQGVKIPLLLLHAFDISTASKIRFALQHSLKKL